MILTHEQKPGQTYNKIAAIKAIRTYNKMGLKECKEAVETAEFSGSASIPNGIGDLGLLRRNLALAGSFTIESSEAELYAGIEDCIKLAVSIRDYKTARSLINTLPPTLRAGHVID